MLWVRRKKGWWLLRGSGVCVLVGEGMMICEEVRRVGREEDGQQTCFCMFSREWMAGGRDYLRRYMYVRGCLVVLRNVR